MSMLPVSVQRVHCALTHTLSGAKLYTDGVGVSSVCFLVGFPTT